jgi:hypothetical protein
MRYVTGPGTTTEMVVLLVIAAAIWLANLHAVRMSFGVLQQCHSKVFSSATPGFAQQGRVESVETR